MKKERDLKRTRQRLLNAAVKEFAAKGLAGARTGAIARRAGVNERMLFYCFGSKARLYRAAMSEKLAQRASVIESNPEDDLAASLVRGFQANCEQGELLRMWLWEALQHQRPVAQKERQIMARAEVARLRRARLSGALAAGIDEPMLLLASSALRVYPLILPQVTRLITGLDPCAPGFRRKWSACLQWFGTRLQPAARPRRTAKRVKDLGRARNAQIAPAQREGKDGGLRP